MANPLTTKCRNILDNKYKVFRISVIHASKSGNMDDICCIEGKFYGFEYKYKTDTPSEAQKDKINRCIDNGGLAYFIRSVEQLEFILNHDVLPTRYIINEKTRIIL